MVTLVTRIDRHIANSCDDGTDCLVREESCVLTRIESFESRSSQRSLLVAAFKGTNSSTNLTMLLWTADDWYLTTEFQRSRASRKQDKQTSVFILCRRQFVLNVSQVLAFRIFFYVSIFHKSIQFSYECDERNGRGRKTKTVSTCHGCIVARL